MYSISELIFSREENLVYLKQIMIDCKKKRIHCYQIQSCIIETYKSPPERT